MITSGGWGSAGNPALCREAGLPRVPVPNSQPRPQFLRRAGKGLRGSQDDSTRPPPPGSGSSAEESCLQSVTLSLESGTLASFSGTLCARPGLGGMCPCKIRCPTVADHSPSKVAF